MSEVEAPVGTNELSLIQQLVNANMGQSATPAVEATAIPATPTVEETPAAEATPIAKVEAPVVEVDYNKILEEKTGGKYKSFEEIEALEPKPFDPIQALEGDAERAIFNALREGKLNEVQDYLNRSLTDYSTMTPEKLVELKIKQDNPTFNDSEVRQELMDRYALNLHELTEEEKDGLTEREIKAHENAMERGARLLKSDAYNAQTQFESQKTAINITPYKAPEPIAPPVEAEPVALTPEQVEQGKSFARATVDKVANQTFSIKAGEEGQVIESSFILSNEDKSALADYLYNRGITPEDESRFSKNGDFDPEAWAKAGLFALYADKIVSASMTEARNKALEQFVAKDLKGISINPQTVADTSKPVDVNTQLLQQILASKQKNS